MFVKAWSSKPRDRFVAAGAGVQVSASDRARYFEKRWTAVSIELEDGRTVPVNLTSTFWTTCPELRSAQIGHWLMRERIVPWPAGRRATLVLTPLGERRFRLTKPETLG